MRGGLIIGALGLGLMTVLGAAYLFWARSDAGAPVAGEPLTQLSRLALRSELAGEAGRAWEAMGGKDAGSVPALEDFIRRYGDTAYGKLARERLIGLTKYQSQSPPANPPEPPPPSVDPCSNGAGSSPATALCVTPLSSPDERSLKPKDVFKDCAQCPEMVVVPAGKFVMGSPATEEQRHESEGPPHEVTFSKPFAVGRFAATFDDWEACAADGGCSYRPADTNSWGRGRRPVIDVGWNDAKGYLAWLSRKTGKDYRLLTEAEREYVTRAGTTTAFSTGPTISTNAANYNGNYTYGGGAGGDYRAMTVPVYSFNPNPWGLYQLQGNVWEWVEDCWNANYDRAPTDGSARTGGDCAFHLIRGGSWWSPPSDLRAATRLEWSSETRSEQLGFRVARSLTPAPPKPAISEASPKTPHDPLSGERERTLKRGDTFTECDICPEMVVVPAESFTMGSPANEARRFDSEGPEHKVTFAKPFAVGRFAVTFDEWDACVADGGCSHQPLDEKNWGRGKRPVINISWNDAKRYVAWLSRKTGKPYRLLSEAEWEYVTRSGKMTPFWTGPTISTDEANYNGNFVYAGGVKGDNRAMTVPVDTFKPNPWGLYQVHGNVWVWIEDCWHEDYKGAPTDGSVWAGGNCALHLIRGGSWFTRPDNLRAANRLGKSADWRRGGDVGLRVARTLSR
jgi:formylglycine-generating enzyme required for sulfatase activity